MSHFINLKNGTVSLDTYRFPEAEVTDFDDILDQLSDEESETLTCSLDLYLDEKSECILHDYRKSFKDSDELQDAIFGELDYLQETLKKLELEHLIDEMPDLRDHQHFFMRDNSDELISE